jgi:hypothetical protein
MRLRRLLAAGAALTLLGALLVVAPLGVAARTIGSATQVPRAGTGGPVTGESSDPGDASNGPEFPGGGDEDGSDPYSANRIDRSLDAGHVGRGVSVNAGKKAKSNPELKTNFEGLNHYQQRYARQGNQFSLEPPDQGLCVGGGYVVEAVNDVFNVFDGSGTSLLPDNTATNIVSGFPRDVNHAVDLNSFYGYAPAIDRTLPAGTARFGQFVTDPTCIYDAQTHRFFLVVLTLETVPTTGGFTHVNHLDLAVSATSNPTGTWNIYRVDVTNDGSNSDASNACPCLGDYPHIGADANGVYLTTNAYPWSGNGFDGAQIYAFSKAQLAAGAASVTMVHIDTWGAVNAPSDAGSTQPGFTVWPAQSPGTSQFNLANGGTEYFLSSNAADEATHPVAGTGGDYTSSQIVQWTLSNTSTLNSSPALSLSNRIVSVNRYAIPPKQRQPDDGTLLDKTVTPDTALGDCVNDTTTVLSATFGNFVGCWALVVGSPDTELMGRPDSNDTRMQQVMYANGKLWGALDTAVSFDTDLANNRAGIAWYVLNPTNGAVVKQGTYGIAGASLTYPAIGVTAAGRGVVAFSYTDPSTNPSAAYAPIDASAGVGDTHIVATGAARHDGFSEYPNRFGGRPRWGDYGAAAVDGNSIWIASEMTQSSACDYTDWGGPFFDGGSGDNLLGTCGGASHGPGTRSALANWSTRISKVVP